MITNDKPRHFSGLSTDTKPALGPAGNGYTFTELDTGLEFIYDCKQNHWISTSTASDTPTIGIKDIKYKGRQDLVDTYTIEYTNGASTSFTVTNGRDGIGSEASVGNGILFDTNTKKIKIDPQIVATWDKIVVNKEGTDLPDLTTILINDTTYKVGTGTGVGLVSVEWDNNTKELVFTLADGTEKRCSLESLVVDVPADLQEHLDDLDEEVDELTERVNNLGVEYTKIETGDEIKLTDLKNMSSTTIKFGEDMTVSITLPTNISIGYTAEVIIDNPSRFDTTGRITVTTPVKYIEFGRRVTTLEHSATFEELSLLFTYNGISLNCYISEILPR